MAFFPGKPNPTLELTGSSSGHIVQNASAITVSYSFFWPPAQGSPSTVLTNDGSGNLTWSAPSGGTVTSVSVVSANGLSGTVATSTTTPAITLSTAIVGVLKGDGTGIFAAIPNTDYVTPSGNITGSSGSFTGSLGGDITGTQGATALSATTNSTLTTLSGLTTAGSLAVSGSQVSGGTFGIINGNALTNLSAANIGGVLPIGVTGGSGLSIATSQLTGTINLTTQASGTLQAAQEAAHTGDVTNTAGSLALSLVATTNSTLTSLTGLTTANSLTSATSLALSGNQISGGTFGAVNGSAITNLAAANLSGVLPVGVTGGSGLSIAESQVVGLTSDLAGKQATLPSVYDQLITIVTSGGNGSTTLNGPITSGTAITLPGAMTYVGAELQIYLNGLLQVLTVDWNTSGAGPTFTAFVFTYDLVVGDVLHLVKLRNN